MQDAKEAERRDMEDTLHVGGTRPAMLLGVPVLLSISLLLAGYIIWVNVTGICGFCWAVAIVGPCWLFARIATAHDLYGIDVMTGWLRTSGITLDRHHWAGGSTRSPLPAESAAVYRGMHHAG